MWFRVKTSVSFGSAATPRVSVFEESPECIRWDSGANPTSAPHEYLSRGEIDSVKNSSFAFMHNIGSGTEN